MTETIFHETVPQEKIRTRSKKILSFLLALAVVFERRKRTRCQRGKGKCLPIASPGAADSIEIVYNLQNEPLLAPQWFILKVVDDFRRPHEGTMRENAWSEMSA